MKYELTVDADENWGVCEEHGGDVIADMMTKENANMVCASLNFVSRFKKTFK